MFGHYSRIKKNNQYYVEPKGESLANFKFDMKYMVYPLDREIAVIKGDR